MAGIFITPDNVERLSEILCFDEEELTTYNGCLSDRAIEAIAEAFKDQVKLANIQGHIKSMRETLLDFAFDD